MFKPEYYAEKSPHDLLQIPEYEMCLYGFDQNRLMYSGRMMIETNIANGMDPWGAQEEVELLKDHYDRLGDPGRPLIMNDFKDEGL